MQSLKLSQSKRKLTDCAVTMFAPTNDVSRHIGSPQVRQTPKTPIRTRTRPPISLQCPSIEEREGEKEKTSNFTQNQFKKMLGYRERSQCVCRLVSVGTVKILLPCFFAVMLNSQMTLRSTDVQSLKRVCDVSVNASELLPGFFRL